LVVNPKQHQGARFAEVKSKKSEDQRGKESENMRRVKNHERKKRDGSEKKKAVLNILNRHKGIDVT